MKVKSLSALISLFVIAVFVITNCDVNVKETDNSGLVNKDLTDLGSEIGKIWKNTRATNLTTSAGQGMPDFAEISDPVVMQKDNKYLMWYSGKSYEGVWRICFATSLDGITWLKDYDNMPVLSETENSIDSSGLRVCSVIYDDMTQTYKMWYRGFKVKTAAEYSCNIVFASSKYPNKNWTKYPNNDDPASVLKITDKYYEGFREIGKVAVMQRKYMIGNKVESDYHLWCVRDMDETDGIDKPQIFYIYSPSEVEFHLFDVNSPDVLRYAPVSSFFKDGYCMPTVIQDYYENNSAYKLWFLTMNKSGKRSAGFAYTTLLQGSYFNTFDKPVLNSGDIMENGKDLINPCVIRSENKYKMWFSGKGNDDIFRICYSESTNQ